ncbi:MAG: prolyl oligopeptidase family serine peptidase [Candidatus Aminicenantes bacterium]|nr:MAG: prolyl oligopeptidase family serine peptidase [Candidatus Aminicenantes bacterium]
MRFSRKLVAAALIFCFLSSSAWLGADDKRPFTIDDYASWRSITSTSISDDGKWVTYAYRKTKADDEFFIKSLTSDKEFKLIGASDPKFSDDSLWAAYILNLPRKEAEKLRKQKKPVPRKAELIYLSTGEKMSFENVSSFSFSKGSGFLALKKPKTDPKAKHKGSDLILYDLKAKNFHNLGNVAEFKFNKSGTYLAYSVDAADKSGNGLYLFNLSRKILTVLDADNVEYSQLTWDEKGTALAALKGEKQKEFKEKDNILLAFTEVGTKNRSVHKYDPANDPNFPKDMVISERSASSGRSRFRRSPTPVRGNLFWSEDNTLVFCGLKEQEKIPEKPGKKVKPEKGKKSSEEKAPEKKKAEDIEEEEPPADVDIWHWNDEKIQSVQKIRADRDRNFTYRSVYNLETKRFIRLCDERIRTATIAQDGKWAIGRDEKDYISDWKESLADYYRLNTKTGERTLMFKGQKRTLGLSPDSKHFLYWKDSHIWDYVISTEKIINLTAQAPVSFIDQEYDHPGTKPPYGVTGWTKDGKAVILNHKYDLYLQPLDGSPAKNLTGGKGTEKEIRFRYVQTDPEEKSIDLEMPLLISAFGHWTKEAGYFRLNEGKLKLLVYQKKSYGRLIKAKKADHFFYTIEDFKEFPNYHVADQTFQNPRRITDANPHQKEFKWGRNILVEYTNKNDKRLQGVLMIPEEYKEGEKLPMLVDFYEKNSQNLYRFSRLVYRDTPMFYKYVSNGYLVLLPDVHFNTRTTHSDMLDCVESAVKKVIELGYADPKRIGLHGHSFSGQGGALIATKSKMFAAVVVGAAATNLISDFNQLWKSSGTSQHRYDYYGQGRFGTNPFDDRELYIKESALFNAETMDTPLLLFHGTDDGSVEWLQAIEFYNALRFLGKNVILASYPGQGHHLDKLENQIDFQHRMEEFYDHYLKGKPAPEWMTKGVPYLKKKALK